MTAAAAAAAAGAAVSIAGQLHGSEKSKDIDEILRVLEDDADKSNVEPSKHDALLQQLRNYTTSLDGLDPLLTRRGVSVCCRYGLGGTPSATSRLGLRCLCNVLLLAEPTRQMFVDENYLPQTVERMKNDNADDELQAARLLLLCTYGTNSNFVFVFEQCHLAEVMNTNISRRAKLFMNATQGTLPPADVVAACSETLKLLYNLTAQYPQRTPMFSDSLLPILKILNTVPIPSSPLQPPVSWLVNALIPLVQSGQKDQESRQPTQSSIFPQFDSNFNVDRLAHILDLATRAYKEEEMDQQGSALLQLLLGVAETAPTGPKARLRELLLPSREDQEQVLGRGDSLSARLLRFCTSAIAPHLRDLVLNLLFELSDKDEQQFVRNVGYGFAAGFLLSRGSLLPLSNASEPRTTAEKETQQSGRDDDGREGNEKNSMARPEDGVEINPITGQRRDREPDSDLPEMTDEEKEREAERLFVLFERLRATGVVDVENPVASAVREGRFEEVD